MHHRVERLALARLEVGADGVGDRYERDLRDLVVRDAENLRSLLLVHQMERRPDGAEPPRARREHEGPRGGDDRAEHRRDERIRLALVAAHDARNHVDRDLVDVLGEVHDGVADARHLPLTRPAAALEVRKRDLAPELPERGPLLRVGDDDEVPVLGVARGGRLLGELQALLEHLALDGTREVEPLADGAGRREQLVRGQLQHRLIIAGVTSDELTLVDAWWRAANYLSVGQIYLLDNALLREPLRLEHVKPRLLGHFGTTPGLNLVYVHMNRAIRARDLDAIAIWGPGHGGPGVVANAYLEGTYSEVYSHITEDAAGLLALFRQFSFPGGIPSHVAPETPGSIHEGGELGYALAHAYGAAFDNPRLVVACVVGDGEAETGPLATSWHANKFVNRERDGAVLPILHLNGYKIANPTVLARIPEAELLELMRGYGYDPLVVAGDDPATVHRLFADTLDHALDVIATREARPPMIVLRTPKGWTGPEAGSGRAHPGADPPGPPPGKRAPPPGGGA